MSNNPLQQRRQIRDMKRYIRQLEGELYLEQSAHAALDARYHELKAQLEKTHGPIEEETGATGTGKREAEKPAGRLERLMDVFTGFNAHPKRDPQPALHRLSTDNNG